jgi:hypothetical protein
MKRVLALWFGLLLMIVPAVQSQPEEAQPKLNLVFALDVSGSMDAATTRNEYPNVDWGLRVPFNRNAIQGESRPSDPLALRFSVTESLMEWLGNYVYNQSEHIQINASVVAFEDAPSVLMDWTRLGRSDSAVEPVFEPLDRSSLVDENSTRAQNADFIELYNQLAALFETAPDGDNVIIFITDSVPCRPSGLRDASAPRYDRYCEDIPSMVRHINGLPVVGSGNQYVLFLNALSPSQRWELYPDVRAAWEQQIGRDGAFLDLTSPEELPVTMTEIVLRELAYARGIVTPEEVPVTEALRPQDYTALGMSYSRSGTFEVAPYQSYMDIMAAMPDAAIPLTFIPPDGVDPNDVLLFESEEKLLRMSRVYQPVAGGWRIGAGTGGGAPVWVLFRPAEAQLTLSPENPVRFTEQRLVYRLIDDTGNPLTVTPDTAPQFDIEVLTPDGDTIPLSAMSIGENGKAFVSPPFVPVEAGEYELSIAVSPGNAQVWRTPTNYAFLNPQRKPDIVAAGLTFKALFTVTGRLSGDNQDGSSAITMPRSLPLDVQLSLLSSEGHEVSLPEGLSAEVIFSPPAAGEDACPTQAMQVMNIEPENRLGAKSTVRFDRAGECQVEVRMAITSALPPFNGATRSIAGTGLSRYITVTPTQRLTLRLLQADGQTPVSSVSESDQPDYVMEDRDSTPGQWNPRQITIRAEIVNEAGRPVSPEFLDDTPVVNRTTCSQQRIAARSEETLATEEAPSTAESIVVDAERIVPLQLKITNNATESDVAADKGICFYATDSDGVYLATVTGLEPGDYTVTAFVDRNVPALNYERFEYDPALFENSASTTYAVTARLKVHTNPVRFIQIGGLLVILGISTVLFIRQRIRIRDITVAPLKARPAIYRITQPQYADYLANPESANIGAEMLWSGNVPTGRKALNTVVFTAKEFVRNPELALLGIQSLRLTTKKSQEVSSSGGAYANLAMVGGDPLKGDLLNQGQSRLIAEDRDARYYIANGITSPTVRQILDARVQ